MKIVASSHMGLENVLAKEILELGGTNVETHKRFISFHCDNSTFFKIHFFSRIAFRFYREVARFDCFNRRDLYNGVQSSFEWLKWIPSNKSFCVQVTGQTTFLNHSHFTSLEVKNAIIDLQKSAWGKRSNISIDSPDLVIHLHLYNGEAILSLQSTLDSLHKRGYRPAIGNAPLKENLAAGLLQLTGWDGTQPLIDIMCGSGTFLIESMYQILKIPVLKSNDYLFKNWVDFDNEIYLFEKSKLNFDLPKVAEIAEVIGYEIDRDVFNQAKFNISLSNFENYINLYNDDFTRLRFKGPPGIVLCNPPYGKKLGNQEELIQLYIKIGEFVKKQFSGWEFWLLSGNPSLTRHLKLKSSLKIPISNGGIDCRWIKYFIN